MSKLFISRLAHDLFTICYEDKEGKSKAYKENWNPVSFASEQEAIDWLESIEKERSRADEAIALSSEEAEAFINKQEWIFASTCEKTNPHEYIVKKRLSESSQRKFERFVATIKTNPSVVVINGYSCSNFILGDHYYWIKEPYENVAAFLICRAKKLYLELKDGIYYYNAQKVQEDIKRREQWKKDLQEEMNRRSSLTSTKPHLSRNYIDAISSDGESDNDAYKPVPREMFQRTDKDAHRVLFGDLVWSNDFNLQVPLQVVIGKDINQAPVLGDISKMPNLLVAGGKSINCIDAILLSILCKASPRQVRFLMIDTGVTYLPRYEGIPHLIAPVVCDTALALDVLKWAESEMNRRYELFSKKGVKDVSSYNRSLDTDEKPLPRLLIVVKDIVDLISVQRREVLTVIMTLLSDWYPGIHLVLTTPKSHIELLPDELINLVAAKLVYGMSSSEDIKKILRCDVEDRSGHGEMIYAPLAAPIPIQCQGITVPDNDVFNAVDYLKRNYGTNYDPAVVKLIVGDQDNDPDIIFSDDTCSLKEFIDAMDAVILDGKISASMIQRRLGISYARAAAIIDEFEQRGYVGAFQGIKPRKVLIDESEWEETKKNLMDNGTDVSDRKLMINASEYNWSLHGPGDWSTVEWEIYYDRTYRTKVSFVPKLDRESKKSIDLAPVENSGTMDEKAFAELVALINTNVWRDPNIEIRANDGEAWKIDYYSEGGDLVNTSGKKGYIYGEKLLLEIVNLLAKLQNPYRSPSYVNVRKKRNDG